MENAADALKMAGAVLVFVLALGISISSLSQARETAQRIVEQTDRESSTLYIEDEKATERTVGLESIIPTIYRAYKENYKIFFYDNTGNPLPIYQVRKNGVSTDINYIDGDTNEQNGIKGLALGSDIQKENFIMALLYGNSAKFKKSDGTIDTSITFSSFMQDLNGPNAENSSQILLNDYGIYDTILKEGTFIEKYGVYYQDDINKDNLDTDIDIDIENNTPDINKDKKRVISYYKK